MTTYPSSAGSRPRPSSSESLRSSVLASPLELNLKDKVVKVGKFYVKNGEFSDLWMGEWVDGVKEKGSTPGAKVAIKQLRGAAAHNHELHEATRKKLDASGLKWLGLHHPNVLKFHGLLYDYGYLPSIVSPYCDNGNVLEFLKAAKSTLSTTLTIILGIARGLEYLHSVEIVHGDLRAANILIDDEHNPVIADFGLTFVIDHSEFTTNKIAGPARWTAPEILDPPEDTENDPPYSPASDIFAFGMTMIEILTEKPPYRKIKNDSAVIFRILKGERPEIPDSIAEFKDLKEMVESTWKENPKERPTATDVKHVMEKHLKVVEDSVQESTLFRPFRILMDTFRGFFGSYNTGGAD